MTIGSNYMNVCETGDNYSKVLFAVFKVVTLLTYIPMFYYVVTSVMLAQCICLIRVMVSRRVNMI